MGQAFGKTKVPTTAKGKAELRSKMSDEQVSIYIGVSGGAVVGVMGVLGFLRVLGWAK